MTLMAPVKIRCPWCGQMTQWSWFSSPREPILLHHLLYLPHGNEWCGGVLLTAVAVVSEMFGNTIGNVGAHLLDQFDKRAQAFLDRAHAETLAILTVDILSRSIL